MARDTGGASKNLARNTAFLLVNGIVSRFSGLAITFVIARSLGADGIGVYATAMAIYQVGQYAGAAGTGTYLQREMGKDPSKAGPLIVHLSIIGLAVTGTLVTVVQLIVPFLGYSPELQTGVSIVIFGIIARVLNSIQSNAFIAWGDTRFQPVVGLLGSGLMVTVSLSLLAAGFGITSILITFVAIGYLQVLVWYFLINRYIVRLRWRVQPRKAASLFWEMKTFTASSLLNAFFTRPEIILLSVLSSEREAGYFAATVKVIELWTIVPSVFLNNVFPLLSRSFHVQDGRFASIQTKSTRLMLAFALPITVGLFVAAPKIIPAFYGPDFDPAIDQLRLIAPNIFLYVLMEVFWRVLSARDRHGSVVRSQVLSIPVRIVTAYLLILHFDAAGAAVATTIGFSVHLAILMVSARRSGAVIGLASSWRFLLAALAMGGVLWAVQPYAPLAVLVVVGMVAYTAAVVVLRALPAEDREMLRRLSPRRKKRTATSSP